MRHAIALALALAVLADEPSKPDEEAIRQLVAKLEETPDPALIDDRFGFEGLPAETRTRILEVLARGLEQHPEYVQEPTSFGWPRLHLAAFRGQAGCTPLHYARSVEVADALIEAGAAVDAKDNEEGTPLDLARDVPEFADLLRKHGANE